MPSIPPRPPRPSPAGPSHDIVDLAVRLLDVAEQSGLTTDLLLGISDGLIVDIASGSPGAKPKSQHGPEPRRPRRWHAAVLLTTASVAGRPPVRTAVIATPDEPLRVLAGDRLLTTDSGPAATGLWQLLMGPFA